MSTSAIARARPVIRGMTFIAEPGKMTALVGPSGGGKSTVFNLILRFYYADARRRSRSTARTSPACRAARFARQVAYVGQDVFLFHGTVRENIAIGKPGASEAEIVAAAKAAHAHEFISGISGRIRHPRGRARCAALRRRAPAHRDCAGPGQERADHPARRSHRVARFGIRAAGAGRDDRICARAAPRSPSPTGCLRSPTPTVSSWSKAARSSKPAAHDELMRAGGRYAVVLPAPGAGRSQPVSDRGGQGYQRRHSGPRAPGPE